jgi:DNA polymerase I-like protein with 3'-5' exonuclease and polymerase domains
LGHPQPEDDIHAWNIANVFNSISKDDMTLNRDDAKVMFFGWLYNPDSEVIQSKIYDRDAIVETFYSDGEVSTPFGRNISVDRRRALSYIVQSTTSDLVIDRAVEIDKFLQDKKSFVSHIVHDEIAIDLSDEDRDLVPEIKEIFSNNKLDKFMVNLSAGKNYQDLEELKI